MSTPRRRRASTVIPGYPTTDLADSTSPGTKKDDPSSGGLTFRVVLLGVPGVGKTAITVRYTTRRFIGEYDPTLEYLCRYNTKIDSKDITMEIQDTAGYDDFGHRSRYAIWGDAFLFVYSITDRSSFEHIVDYKRCIENVLHTSQISGVLVGNKNDLDDEYRAVSHLEGVELGDELGLPFFEVSAKDGGQIWDVADVFENLFREWTRNKQLKRKCRARASLRSSTDWARTSPPPSPSESEGETSGRPNPIKKAGSANMRKAVNKLILIQRFTRTRFFSM
ncbi:ras-related and estrogen-regulated growth inhibitor-like [Diadema antillarum]|uniref:ras-related and estrogen-regulated growth inhibitor-like n=1 Tax=Diadema antillarum TaxID=105358 RepID=UPI003A8B8326